MAQPARSKAKEGVAPLSGARPHRPVRSKAIDWVDDLSHAAVALHDERRPRGDHDQSATQSLINGKLLVALKPCRVEDRLCIITIIIDLFCLRPSTALALLCEARRSKELLQSRLGP